MRILILGGDGMLGHELLCRLSSSHDVRVTLRQSMPTYQALQLFHPGNAYAGIDIRLIDGVRDVLDDFRPDAVVNAVGLVKQRPDADNAIDSIEINALFPHRLAALCAEFDVRLLHMSTDCVFSGRVGNYREDDTPDALDLYGRTKLLGELSKPHCLTLRTSIIGRELSRYSGLLEWFLAQKGSLKGFRQAIFSGFTTIELARIIERLLADYPRAAGLYHVSSEPIAKYDLLVLLRKALGIAIDIVPDDGLRIDRSLDSSRFRSEFDYRPPTWEQMADELAHHHCGARP